MQDYETRRFFVDSVREEDGWHERRVAVRRLYSDVEV
jgi:hypothetical protein